MQNERLFYLNHLPAASCGKAPRAGVHFLNTVALLLPEFYFYWTMLIRKRANLNSKKMF